MISKIEEFIEQTQLTTSPTKLKRMFLSAVQSEGYENAVFARARSRRLTSIPWSEFPPGYLDVYKERQWDRIDPVVQHVMGARTPFRWSDIRAQNGFTRLEKNFFGECRELKVHSGITIPIHGPGHEVDLISLSVRGDDQPPPNRLVHAYMLSVQYWLKYCELTDRREFMAAILTPQEVECLRWAKEGKTNWEIGEILCISEKTAEFHIGNAMRKLGATNRITAVMIAIKRGILHL